MLCRGSQTLAKHNFSSVFPKMKYCYLTQKRYATTASVCFYWICERHCAKKSSAHRLPAQRGPLVKDKIGWQAMGQVLYAWGLNWSFDTNSNSDRDIFMPHLGKDEIQYLAFKHVHCYLPKYNPEWGDEICTHKERLMLFGSNHSHAFQTSQELRMLSRSLSDCKSLFLNVMIQVSQFIRNGQLCH